MNPPDISLDDLYRDAIIAGANSSELAQRAARETLHQMRSWFSDLRNWRQGSSVELIREGTSLGTFAEYIHPTGARRLIREPGLAPFRREEI